MTSLEERLRRALRRAWIALAYSAHHEIPARESDAKEAEKALEQTARTDACVLAQKEELSSSKRGDGEQ